MGDRYELNIKCAHCDANNQVYYAPTSGADTMRCHACDKYSFVKFNFKTKKLRYITMDDVKEGLMATTNTMWTDEEITRQAEERYEKIKGWKD